MNGYGQGCLPDGAGGGRWFRRSKWLVVFLAATYLTCLINPLTRPFDFDVNFVLALASVLGGALHGALRPWWAAGTSSTVRTCLAKDGVVTWWSVLMLEGAIALLGVLAVAAASRIVLPACGFGWGLLYFVLGPVFSMAFGLALGLAAAVLARSRRRAAGWAAAAVAATVLYPAVRALFVPVAFAYSPAFGDFPGPIYDPVVGVAPAYLWARLHTVAIIATILSVMDMLLRRTAPIGRTRPPAATIVTLGWALPTTVALALLGDRVGMSSGFAAIERELDGTTRTAHFIIHYPAESRTARYLDWVSADLEAAHGDLSRYLETELDAPIHVYVYPSREAKKRLMGAGRTSMAFPRSRSLHLNADTAYPHPVLRHELAHVLSGPRGMPGLQVSPLPGLTEGLAVAGEEVSGAWTVHEWAAAMKRIGKLPDVRNVLTPTDFWRHPGGVAYTACGSFVRWLIETRGIDRFWQAYRWGRVSGAYGMDLDALVAEWERHLDTVSVPKEALTQARYRFSRRGLFETPCVRTQQRLRARADDLYVHGKPRAAARRYEQAAGLVGGDPRLFRAAMFSWLAAGENDIARRLGKRIVEPSGDAGPLVAVPVAVMIGTAEFRKGDTAEAVARWTRAANAGISTPDVRRALCLIHAAGRPHRLRPVLEYLAGRTSGGLDLLRLGEARQRAPDDPIVNYLLARRFQSAESWDDAVKHYQAALDAGLPHVFLTREALRNRAVSALFAGNPEAARNAVHALESHPLSTRADRILACRLRARLNIVTRNMTREGASPTPQK